MANKDKKIKIKFLFELNAFADQNIKLSLGAGIKI